MFGLSENGMSPPSALALEEENRRRWRIVLKVLFSREKFVIVKRIGDHRGAQCTFSCSSVISKDYTAVSSKGHRIAIIEELIH